MESISLSSPIWSTWYEVFEDVRANALSGVPKEQAHVGALDMLGKRDLAVVIEAVYTHSARICEPHEQAPVPGRVRFGLSFDLGAETLAILSQSTKCAFSKIDPDFESIECDMPELCREYFDTYAWYVLAIDAAYREQTRFGLVDICGKQVALGRGCLIVDGIFLSPETAQVRCDIARARAQALTLLSGRRGLEATGAFELALKIFEWQHEVLIAHGNNGFEIAKAVESVFKAAMSQVDGCDFSTVSSFDKMVAKLKVKEAKLSRNETPFADELERLAKSASTVTTAAECFGLMKLTGHPIISARRSARALRAIACTPKQIDVSAVIALENEVKAMLLTGYLETRVAWPTFVLPPKKGTALHRLWRDNVIAFAHDSVPLSDYMYIWFDATLTLDTKVDYASLLDDKAISEPASEFGSYWEGRGKENRRLLTRALAMPVVDVGEYVDRAREGAISRDPVIALTCKNQEMKVNARAFSMDDFRERCVLNVIEESIGRVMSEFKLDTTMTESRAETEMRFQDLARVAGQGKTFVFEADLSAWNTNWRSVVTGPVARIIGSLYGDERLFTYPNRYYASARVCMRARGWKPRGAGDDPLADDDLTWGPQYGVPHLGGLEGKSQKLWTICTIAPAKIAARIVGVSLTVIVQGDNLVGLIELDREDRRTLAEVEDLFMNELERQFSLLGQEMKPDESFTSRSTLTYSKKIWSRGCEYHPEAKFASRISPFASQRPTGFASGVETIFGAAASASAKATDPLRFYGLAVVLSAIHLQIMKRARSRNQVSRIATPLGLALALTVTSEIGGIAALGPEAFMMRGGSDALSGRVGFLKAAADGGCYLARRVLSVLHSNRGVWSRKVRHERLVEDPRAIPLASPRSAELRCADAVQEVARDIAVNEDILDCFEAAEEVHDDLVSALVTMRPLYPAVVRAIVDASPVGAARRISSRFAASSTLRDMSRDAGVDLLRPFFDDDAAAVEWLMLFTARQTLAMPNASAYEIVESYRARWGLGKDQLLGLSTISPFASRRATRDMTGSIGGYAVGVPSNTQRGPMRPYFGNKTRVTKDRAAYETVEHSSAVRSARELVELSSQLQAGPSLRRLISALIFAICGESLETLERFLPTSIGGTVAHRFDELRRAAYYLSVLPNVATSIAISSNFARMLADDYPLAVQEYYLVSIAVMTRAVTQGRQISSMFLLPDTENVATLNEIPPDIDDWDEDFRDCTANPLLGSQGIEFVSLVQDWPSQISAEPSRASLYSLVFSLLVRSAIASFAALAAAELVITLPLDVGVAELEKVDIETVIDAAGAAAAFVSVARLGSMSRRNYAAAARLEEVSTAISLAFAKGLAGLWGKDTESAVRSCSRYGLELTLGRTPAKRRTITMAGLITRSCREELRRKRARKLYVFADDTRIVMLVRATAYWVLYRNSNTLFKFAKAVNTMAEAEVSTEMRASNVVASCEETTKELEIRQSIVREMRSTVAACRSLRECPAPAVPHIQSRIEIGRLPWSNAPTGNTRYDSTRPIVGLSPRERVARWIAGFGIHTSLYGWFAAALRSIDTPSRALVVGAGSGAWSAALVSNGCAAVHEIDLLSMRPAVAQDGANARGPESYAICGQEARRVSPHAYIFAGGDAFDPAYGQLEFDEYDMVIFDVQRYPAREDLERIGALHSTCPRVLIRHLLFPEELASAMRLTRSTEYCILPSPGSLMLDVVMARGVDVSWRGDERATRYIDEEDGNLYELGRTLPTLRALTVSYNTEKMKSAAWRVLTLPMTTPETRNMVFSELVCLIAAEAGVDAIAELLSDGKLKYGKGYLRPPGSAKDAAHQASRIARVMWRMSLPFDGV